jgi:hypothetical protein
VTRDGFFGDPQSWFYAEAFTVDDVDRASAWLQRQGIVDGIRVAEFEGPVRTYLTDDGVMCVEAFDSDPTAFLKARRSVNNVGGITVRDVSGGNVQIAGHHAQQTMTVGATPERLELMIRGIGQLLFVVGLVEATDQAQAVDPAVEDVRAGRDGGHVRAFLQWARSKVEAGTDEAISAGIAAGIVTVATHAHELGHVIGL